MLRSRKDAPVFERTAATSTLVSKTTLIIRYHIRYRRGVPQFRGVGPTVEEPGPLEVLSNVPCFYCATKMWTEREARDPESVPRQ